MNSCAAQCPCTDLVHFERDSALVLERVVVSLQQRAVRTEHQAARLGVAHKVDLDLRCSCGGHREGGWPGWRESRCGPTGSAVLVQCAYTTPNLTTGNDVHDQINIDVRDPAIT